MSSDPKEKSALDSSDHSDRNKDGSKSDNETDPSSLPPVPLFSLYRFANGIERSQLFFGFVCAVISGLVFPAIIFFFSDLSNSFLKYDFQVRENLIPIKEANHALTKDVNKYCLIFVGIGVLMFISSYLQNLLFSIVSEKQTLKIRETYYQAAIRQNMGWFDEVSTGDLTTRISSDVALIQDGIGPKISYVVQYSSTFIGGFIIAFIRGWQMALVILAVMPLLMVAGTLMGINVGKVTKILQDQYAKSGAIANEVISSMRTVMAFNGQKREVQRYDQNNTLAQKFEMKKAVYLGFGLGSIFFFIYAVYALGFWYGAKLIRNGSYNAGKVLNVFFALVMGGFSLGGAAPSLSAVISARGAAASVFSIIDRISPIDPLDDSKGQIAKNIKGEIELKNIEFSYPTRKEIKTLRNFSLKIHPGQHIALVGESGCGKSTTVSLIQRFYDPLSGSVSIDGVDVRDYNVSSIRKHIAIVSQEPVLFDTTIYQNIAWGAQDYENNPPSREDVIQACKNANIHNFIASLPDQYDTIVGEKGAQLSGGQKQRIAIARALIRNAPILLLDEATSALDTESERLVQAAIDKNLGNRTTITIAHRLSTIKNSDQIYVCHNGSVLESGTHEELVDKKGAYFALVNAQELHKVDSEKDTSHRRKSVGARSKGEDSESIEESSASTVAEDQKEEEEVKPKMGEYRALITLFKRNPQVFRYYFFGSIGSAIDGALFPLFSIFFSKMLVAFSIPDPAKQKSKTNFYALLFFIFAIITFCSMTCRTYFFTLGSSKLHQKLRRELFESIVNQESEFFDQKHNGTGALTTRISSEPESIFKFGSESLPMLVYAAAAVLTGIIIAFTRDWRLTLVVLAVLPIIAFSEGQKAKVMTGRAKQNQIVIEAGAKEAAETIMNIRTVASLTREKTFVNSFNKNNEAPHRSAVRGAYVESISYAFSQASIMLIYALCFYAGSQFVVKGYMNVEKMFNTIYAIFFAAIGLGQASQFLGFIPKAAVSSAKLLGALGDVPKINIRDPSGNSPTNRIGVVSAQDVDFIYPSRPDVKILDRISLHAKPGQTIALVGSSGSGKSTIINLMLRLYDVLGGSVSVEDEDVRNWQLEELRNHLSLVGQEPVLFDYSIADNIRYGKEDATEFEIEQAAKAANIHNVVLGLPDGYATRVGTSGGQISGGQKQRIAIARAIISNPKILLLDEATSALDTESEVLVQKALDVASEGRTTITIAHRLSTIQRSDWIYVFDRGRIAEQGTHQTLTEMKGIYYSLAVQQSLSK
ncbi:hypothetical protein BB560_000183 [Smittium megazygosporum]|uniref:Bile salt export pump n=1 Tax=Smittium megazygosporum TaxID=133381 RepID=A0A2T9ZL72_9FUNG|nr:hypothetical protein BB560_000183 [Smittium megazygosporum]